jgi:VIT1/CCC1 family predicted Fe2+/Mn2+ transporter
MFEVIAKVGVSGAFGALIGLLAVWWVEPTTVEGTVLLIIVWVLIFVILGSVITKLFGKKKIDNGSKDIL